MNEIKIPEHAAAVIEVIESAGFEAFVVGGCVRDCLLGREPSDWDVTTSCPPDILTAMFGAAKGFAVYPTGLRHGTVTVVCGKKPIEVTTYRSDGEYTDHRSPDSVTFETDIARDLERRDFTINAMAYSEKSGLIDLFGGVRDLEAKVIRCVGDAETRFTEDALRIIRALRFASVLDFDIEADTYRAIKSKSGLLIHVSSERITGELSKLLMGKRVVAMMAVFYEIMCQIMPMISSIDMLDSAGIINRLSEGAPLHVKLAALLIGCPDGRVEGFFKLFRFDNKTKARTLTVLAHKDDEISDKLALKRLCRDIGYDSAWDVVRFMGASRGGDGDLSAMLEEIRRNGECYTLSGLQLGGDAVLALGAMPKQVGGILSRLLDGVMEGRLENEPSALLSAARMYLEADASM